MSNNNKSDNNKLINKSKEINKLEKVLNLSDDKLIADAIKTLLQKGEINKH